MSQSSISVLNPHEVWAHFESISAIPRPSGREERIVQFMMNFGNTPGLKTSRDELGNVIIKKPATAGKEESPSVVLQGHVDMVQAKTMNSSFDFDTQGIEVIIEDDWVTANETTLGADNGIGVSMIMAVLSSKTVAHPPIEAIFTVDEEVGMTGAMAVKHHQLDGRILLNLDSENDSEITIGCAGGSDVKISGGYELMEPSDVLRFFLIKIRDLSGGHSGVEIHKGLANAILLFTRLLAVGLKDMDIHLVNLTGGQLTNVIPNYCSGKIAVKRDEVENFLDICSHFSQVIRSEYAKTDPELKIITQPISEVLAVPTSQFTRAFLEAVKSIPNGVHAFSKGGNDLVETSNNLATVRFGEGSFTLQAHTRSFIDKERDKLIGRIKDVFSFAEVTAVGPYPGWEPKFDSNLLRTAKELYTHVFNVKPSVTAIHAGLECGIFAEIFPDMEMISIGPNTLGAHSPDERVQISSVQKSWTYLIELLDTL